MAGDVGALLVHVVGRVQGVGYREWTRRQAMQLGLTGWVRNETDGSVSALIAGPEPAIADMVKRFWKGPQFASVTSVKTEAATIADLPADFRVIR